MILVKAPMNIRQETKTALSLVTGWGQSDTHALVLNDGRRNGSSDAGKPYVGITGVEITAMIKNPPSVEKSRAQWIIGSDYMEHDARDHDAQRQNGRFHVLTLDIDKNNPSIHEVKSAVKAVCGDGSLLIYSTKSATPENMKWRAVIPLAAPIAGADYAETSNAFFDLIEDASQGAIIPDRALARPGQLFFLPNRGDFYEYDIVRGSRLILTGSKILERFNLNRTKRKAAEDEAAAARARKAADRAANKIDETESPGQIFNVRHSVADLLAKYGYTQDGQSNDWRSPYQSSGSFATRNYGDYWISLSDSDLSAKIGAQSKNGHSFGDAFDLFAHFEHGGDPSKAAIAYAKEINLYAERDARQTFDRLRADDLSDFDVVKPKQEPETSISEPEPSADWEADLVKNARGRPVWCPQNGDLILYNHMAWKGIFAFDEFANSVMLLRPVPGSRAPKASFKPHAITEKNITEALRWFNSHGFPDTPRSGLSDVIDAVAREKIISPVADYLRSLSWDGQPRLNTWLAVYCGAVDAGNGITHRMGRAWLIAAVARALLPGCKADNVLMLEGGQGIGKSTMLRALASDAWFFDGLRDLHNKDASSGLRGKWIVELPELSAMRRSDNEAVKAFLSRVEERYRPAYARLDVTEPRRCVFAGTTNTFDYLTDDTGGRRFWPVRCTAIDADGIRRDRDQLWAEAVVAFNSGEVWWLDREGENQASQITATRSPDDPWTADVLAAVSGKTETTTRDIFQYLDIPRERWTKSDTMRIAGIITRAGWVKAGRFTEGPNRSLARYILAEGNAQ